MEAILTEILELMTSGITTLGAGIGSGMNSYITSAFVDATGDTYKLTVLGGCVAIFAGVALSVGLTRLVFGFFTSLGARK